MANAIPSFDKRLRKIVRRHDRMRNGVIHSVNHDGLIIARPRRRRPRFPVRGLALMLAAVFVFKGFLYANLGPATYQDRVNLLQSGTIVEQGGAYIMTMDVISLQLAEWFDKL